MGQSQAEQLLVMLLKLALLGLVVERVTRALLKEKQRDARHQELGQRIVRFLATVLHLAQLLKEVREKMLDGLEQFTDQRFAAALWESAYALLGLTPGRVT